MTTAISAGRIILIGSCEATERIAASLTAQPWIQLTHIVAPHQALHVLRRDPAIDLLLMVPGPTPEPYLELCRSVKFDKRTSFISVLVAPQGDDPELIEAVYKAGADDCLRPNDSERHLVLRITKALRIKQATDVLEDSQIVITALANAIEGKDHYTCGHVERVSSYAVAIGRRVGVDDAGLAALRTGGVVHDIGKIGIPDQILNKPGKLTDEEMDVIRRHPVIGYDILQSLRTFRDVLPIVRWHHEKPNGTGYPDGLSGEAIPLLARITAVADVFDALSTDRPYRKAFDLAKCKAILADTVAKGELDGKLVEVLFEMLDQGGVPHPPPSIAAAA